MRVRQQPIRTALIASAVALAASFVAARVTGQDAPLAPGDYEVWVIDQSDTTPNGGGRLYIVGMEAHETYPSPDQSHAVVAGQHGKQLFRIRTDYAKNAFALEPAATLDLARCRTPSGAACKDPALRPDNAPICPVIESSGRATFVTLRGGGLLVVDSTATPMAIIGEYDREHVHPNGCGGSKAAGKIYLRAGGGTDAEPAHADLYAFTLSGFAARPQPRNTPRPVLVFSHDDRRCVDAHGGALTKGGRYLWVADRFGNRLVVVDTASDTVVNEISLSGSVSSDPAPDILDPSVTAQIQKREHHQPGSPRGGGVCRRVDCRHGADEPVAALRQGLDEARALRGVSERLPQPGDRVVQVVLEIDEHVVGPEAPAQVLTGHDLPGLLEQTRQRLERLLAEVDADAVLAELARREIDLETVEPDDPRHRTGPDPVESKATPQGRCGQ